MALTIRDATAADTPALLELGRHMHAAMPVYSRFLEFDPVTISRRIAEVLETGLVLVAAQDGVIVGFLGLDVLPGDTADELAWWVEPGARGRSGPLLLEAAEDWARKKGIRVLQMVAPARSTVGAFLERRGYVAVETLFRKVFPGLPSRDASPTDP